jgi:plasmid stability protein
MRMGNLIQIQDVRDEVHETLKARAARAGVSLTEYLRTELERVAASPTPDELVARLQSRRRVRPAETTADALRAVRGEDGTSGRSRGPFREGC